jgi:hypothetical protein
MMTIQEIIEILNNKLSGVGQRRNDAFKQGDLELVTKLDLQIEELVNTIAKLQSVA